MTLCQHCKRRMTVKTLPSGLTCYDCFLRLIARWCSRCGQTKTRDQFFCDDCITLDKIAAARARLLLSAGVKIWDLFGVNQGQPVQQSE